jgi:hypothetical protein
MKSCQSVTLELPVHGSGSDYAGAVALALAEANCNGDRDGAEALAGLMSSIRRPAVHNADVELGPWFAAL